MSSGGSDFENPLRPFLSGDLAKIRNFRGPFGISSVLAGSRISERCRGSREAVFKNLHGLREILGAEGPDSRNSRRFPDVLHRQEDVRFSAFDERRGMRHDSSDFTKGSVEGELAEYRNPFEFAFAEAAFLRNDPERDGEVESRSGFADFRRREVDRDPLLRKGKSRISDRRTDPFATLLHGGVPEADDGERRESGGHVGFDGNRVSRNSPNR